MKKKIILYTQRLKIKILEIKDINQKYINGLNDPEVNKFLVETRLYRQTFRTVKKYVQNNIQSRRDLLLGLFTKHRNELIGTARVHNVSYLHWFCSVGICIFNKDYWNKGYASEALEKIKQFIFGELKLHYIEAGVYKDNSVSIKLFKKAGFRIQAIFKQKYRYGNGFRKVVVLGKINPRFDFNLLKCKNG